MGVHDVLALGQRVQVHDPGVQPLVVGRLGRQLGLDLVVLDDAVLLGVDEEHPPRLQAALADDAGGVDRQHADLGGQDDETVVRDPVAAGTQPVAVEHRADERSVGERDVGRSVPRLGERRVELVERTARGIHLGVVLPRLRDHHQHGVRQAAAAEVQQLEHLVEGCGVAQVVGADREETREVTGDDVARELRLAGAHPVAVSLDRVDLAVVRDQPVRVRQRPARERVGGEPRVHEREGRLVALVGEVGEEPGELTGGEHALVDQRAARQRREVDVDLVLGPLAEAERHPLERESAHATALGGHDELTHGGHDAARGGADAGRVDREVAPRQHGEPLLDGDRLDRLDRRGAALVVEGEERRAHGVAAGSRQLDTLLGEHRAQEGVGHLGEDAGAVARVGLGARGAAVLEVDECGDGLADDVVRGLPGQLRHEGDAAGVLLLGRVVEALGCGDGRPHGVTPVVARTGTSRGFEQGTTLATLLCGDECSTAAPRVADGAGGPRHGCPRVARAAGG